jgi:hypothetical protein
VSAYGGEFKKRTSKRTYGRGFFDLHETSALEISTLESKNALSADLFCVSLGYVGIV